MMYGTNEAITHNIGDQFKLTPQMFCTHGWHRKPKLVLDDVCCHRGVDTFSRLVAIDLDLK